MYTRAPILGGKEQMEVLADVIQKGVFSQQTKWCGHSPNTDKQETARGT